MAEFMDSNRPIKTCISEACDDCKISNIIHCNFTRKDLIHFLLTVLPSFLLGGAGIYNVDWWWLIPWLVIIVGYFGFVEIRVMCSHCPHYDENGKTLKCWANYGSPKIWKYRPGPMSFWEKFVFFAGMIFVWGYPIYFLVSRFQWFLLIVYILTVVVFFMTLRIYLCSQCMNFACPMNRVEEEFRIEFFKHNPEVAKSWGIDTESITDL